MAGKVETICQEKIAPIIEQMGYEIVEIEYAKKIDGMNLTFVIDKPNGVFMDDLTKVHKIVSDKLDEINPTNDVQYILNVESPGLDRPIKNQRDFLKNKNKEVEVKLYAPRDGKKRFVGKLIDFSNEKVVIQTKKETLEFERKKVANIVPVIKF